MPAGGPTAHVVKNGHRRHPEQFSPDKLQKSIVAACLNAGSPPGYAENIARRVVSEIMLWIESRPEVTSNDIRRVTARAIKTYHPDASYLYEHHRSIV